MTTAETVVDLLRSTKFRYSSEDDLQMGIGLLLVAYDIPFAREVQLTPGSRIDFLVDSSIGIEVKIGGSVTDLGFQVLRYLEHERVTALIVVTTRATHRDMPTEMEGKKIYVVHLHSSAF